MMRQDVRLMSGASDCFQKQARAIVKAFGKCAADALDLLGW
jgi:hypothetical protein